MRTMRVLSIDARDAPGGAQRVIAEAVTGAGVADASKRGRSQPGRSQPRLVCGRSRKIPTEVSLRVRFSANRRVMSGTRTLRTCLRSCNRDAAFLVEEEH